MRETKVDSTYKGRVERSIKLLAIVNVHLGSINTYYKEEQKKKGREILQPP